MKYKAETVVNRLLEADPDDPQRVLAQYMQLVGQQQAAKAADVLQQFKRSVIAYIKWAHAGDEQGAGYDPDDLRRLRKAKTFAEAEAILAQYETEPSFLSMLGQGYFT